MASATSEFWPGTGVAIRAWFADGSGGPPVKRENIQYDEVMVTMELVEQVLSSAK